MRYVYAALSIIKRDTKEHSYMIVSREGDAKSSIVASDELLIREFTMITSREIDAKWLNRAMSTDQYDQFESEYSGSIIEPQLLSSN